MAVEFLIDAYGITGKGKKIKIARMKKSAEDCFLVGGTIFYINETAGGVYEFFDTDGSLIENVQVGDRPYAYRVVSAGTKDKYYVYYDEIYTSKRWTYYEDFTWGYKAIGGLSLNIGTGKTNTEKVMTKDNGIYIDADSNGYPTIWYQLQQTRNAKAGGCNDWFIPSKNEGDLLVKAIKSGIITGGAIAGSSYAESVFNNSYVWCSSEDNSQFAWIWNYTQQWWNPGTKNTLNSVFFVRAF